jgi:hypothetical protein
MTAKRLLLTISAAAGWGVGAFLMQSAVDEHMAFALAAFISGVVFLVVLFAPLTSVMTVSAVFAWFFAAAAVLLAVIEWDWQALAAAIAYGAAGILSFVVFAYVDHVPATVATPNGVSDAGDTGPRRLIPAFRRNRRPARDQDGDGG